MLEKIIAFSLRNKFIVLLFTLGIFGFGLYSVFQISIGAVPDVTNAPLEILNKSYVLLEMNFKNQLYWDFQNKEWTTLE